MSILHRGMSDAHPEALTSIRASGLQQTREINDSTERPTHTRRAIIRTLLGAGGLVAVGGVTYLFNRPNGGEDRSPDGQGGGAIVGNTLPPFEQLLTLNKIRPPETLNPPTFAEVFTNLGEIIRYDVNFGHADDIPNRIPGGRWGVLQPGQFQLRADWITGYRPSSKGTAADQPNDPNDPRYYAWDFSINMLEQLTQMGADPHDPHVLNAAARVRITIGDAPVLTTQSERPIIDAVEQTATFDAVMQLSRVIGMDGDNYRYAPDVNGHDGPAWAIAGISDGNGNLVMKTLPSIMTGHNLPTEFASVPPLWAQ